MAKYRNRLRGIIANFTRQFESTCMRQIIFFSLLLMSTLFISCQDKKRDEGPRRIEILFLSHDSQHHNSAQYMPLLASALSKEGINFTYTDKLYINLVGGQFEKHGTDTFTANIINKEHPVVQSLQEFSTWDETYVHHKLTEDKTILMERVDGDHHEPWTWVREQGKGRVFSTAYGHDHPAAKVLLDGFHMAIEERNIEEALAIAGDKLIHVQVSENYRGTPGTGQTPWHLFKSGLEKIKYAGAVSIESFTPEIKELAGAVCIWKNLADSQDGFASEGISFLKKLLNV